MANTYKTANLYPACWHCCQLICKMQKVSQVWSLVMF